MGEEGDRVIQGSRRPDGSYRKDVRVRAGYVPQDEQPVYVPRGALVSGHLLHALFRPSWMSPSPLCRDLHGPGEDGWAEGARHGGCW
jgi:hypothetical protein